MTDNKKTQSTNNNFDNSSNTTNGIPNKQQLSYMLQRYSSVQFFPADENKEPVIVSSEIADFKKPIFANIVSGRLLNKLGTALQYQGSLIPESSNLFIKSNFESNTNNVARVLIEGNEKLINTTFKMHQKLLGDDPYNPLQPYDQPLILMEGNDLSVSNNIKLDNNNNHNIENIEYIENNKKDEK